MYKYFQRTALASPSPERSPFTLRVRKGKNPRN